MYNAQYKLREVKNACDESEYDNAYVEYETATKDNVAAADTQRDAAYDSWIETKNECYTVCGTWEAIKNKKKN